MPTFTITVVVVVVVVAVVYNNSISIYQPGTE